MFLCNTQLIFTTHAWIGSFFQLSVFFRGIFWFPRMMYIMPKLLCAQFCRLFLINAFFEFLKFLQILQHWFQFQMQKSRSLVFYRTNEENTCAKVFSKYSCIKIALLNTTTGRILLQQLLYEEIWICCWIMKTTIIKFSKQKISKTLNMFKDIITWELFSMLFGFNPFMTGAVII